MSKFQTERTDSTDDKLDPTEAVPREIFAGCPLIGETCMSLAKAARSLPRLRSDKPVHPTTLFRWATQGRKGAGGEIVRLELLRVGGTNCTSAEALARFCTRLSNGQAPVTTTVAPGRPTLERQAEEAKRVLRQRGLIK